MHSHPRAITATHLGVVLALAASHAAAQDWPQWRGLNRDATVTGFGAPKTWPKDLTQKWKVTVGDGVSTPALVGDTLFFSGPGRGTRAVKVEKTTEGFTAKELWRNAEISVQFNTPVLKDGLLYGFTGRNEFFCLNAPDGTTAWSAPSGGGGDYGSIVDAGSVLLALTPSARLIVFQPGGQAYTELARIKVAESGTYAYPVVSGNRIFIKDNESVRLWTIQ